nr:ubiquitin-like protein FUBI isoform X2 [Styela clava]XP_039271093.1 ubiquitin-like protein FUBI isoform X2 [Styela clava]
MQLFLQAEQLHCVEVDGHETVATLKHLIALREGISVDDQILTCGGRIIEDELSINDSDLQNLCTLDVSSRLLGGKVHGSLARAGKVKGQTPKVDKQEKKKQKTGRAKRRMQYNRRFVNVVPTFGRRRGPNSNS